MTVSTQNATPPKPTVSRNSDPSVSRGTNSDWDFGQIWICAEKFEFGFGGFRGCSIFNGICHKTVSTENATPTKSTVLRNSDSSVSRGANSNWDFSLIWICTVNFEILDLEDFWGVAFSVESVILPRNPQCRETQIPRYTAVQTHVEN